MPFPKDFAWGVATASYQIEGSPLRAGGGASVWDMFCNRPGAIDNAESGWESCNHYELYKQDVALMQGLGAKAYRFSLSWPRILPDGVGCVSGDGLAFYDRLVDELLAAGIAPWATLFHWDYPYALYNRGGWLNAESSRWFADYAQIVVDKLSDRVKHWMTLNEPQCFIGLGHYQGIHAPGEKMQLSQVLLAAHNAMLAHGRAVQVIRASSKSPDPKIGFAPVGVATAPATDSLADIAAAQTKMFGITDGASLWNNTWWIDPVMKGRYPEDGLRAYGKAAPTPAPGDLETICQPLDFFGANIYQADVVKAGKDGSPEIVPHPQGGGRTLMGWPVVPQSLYWGPRFFYERYEKPIVVTENGMANTDWIQSDGQVNDAARIDFLRRHLRELRRATEGESAARIEGYFQWSFMDNFEWAEGYKQRFGIVYVDYATQQRTPKASYHWYKDIIAANGENL